MKTRRTVLSLLGIGLLLCGCASTKVNRMSVDEVKDLSGRWNDTDSQLVSEEMIRDCINRPWVAEFAASENRKPVVIVGTVRNLSSEHIETAAFTTDLERELINSGKVKFVADQNQRLELRAERKAQQAYSTEATTKRLAAETGADYMLKGAVKTIIDKEGNKQVKFYQVDLEAIHIETNEKVWIGSKKIKKYVKKSKVSW